MFCLWMLLLSMVYTFWDFIPDDEIVERHSYAIFAFPCTPPTQYKRDDDMEGKETKKKKKSQGQQKSTPPLISWVRRFVAWLTVAHRTRSAPLTDAIQLHKMVESFTFISISLATPPRLVQPYIHTIYAFTNIRVFFFFLTSTLFFFEKTCQPSAEQNVTVWCSLQNLKPFGFSLLKNFFLLFFFWVSNKKEKEREEHFEDNTNKMPSRSFLSTLSAFFQQYGTKQNE